ncbi:ABC transporter permease subunit [Paratractidigestivibacter sp.]|uniref:amino acid ABC transporter permease n=1 Tax=Paratractidigestivibacter sp. TaxID=2847316 RepID=UPI002ABDD5D1|nr:ABC transporter permease subunit [Paratractidigestivibacter sp.]
MGFAELLSAYGPEYLTALLTTWRITAFSFVLVMVFSMMVTVLRVCPFKPLRVLGDLYVQIFRNIPGAVLILIIVYALPYLKVVLDYEPAVVVCTVLLGTAFGSENFMTGINTIGVGQIEAARSIGLSFTQILRHIVIPQALRSTVLPMTNLLIAVMLTTALGSQVPMSPQELTGIVSYINTRESAGIVTFALSACGYIATALVVGLAGNKLDEKVRVIR